MRAFAILCTLLVAAHVQAADYTYSGFARDLDTGQLMYVETHEIHAPGTREEQRIVTYRRDETAEPFARKTLTYGADRAQPSFQFSDSRSGFAESVTQIPDGFAVRFRGGPSATVRTALIPTDEVAVIDAGFDEFVRAHWDELWRGETMLAPFLVPSRLEAMRFRLRKLRATSIDGATATVIRLSLAGPLGWLLPDIDVTYRDSDRRLMRYLGLTNIRDENGELLSARIDFPDPH